MENKADSGSQPGGRPSKLDRIKWQVLAAAAGGLLALVAALVMLRRGGGEQLPVLTRQAFDQASRQWDQQGPRNYDARILVNAREQELYRVSVRNGEVVSLTRNDTKLSGRRTLGTWSVSGLLGTIGTDLSQVERWQAGDAVAGTQQLRLRAVFDAQFGHPVKYNRTEMRKWGANYDVSWTVELTALP